MKISGLAVLSIIIILPMAILLNSYANNQMKTIELQVAYDSKLQSSTYDAIKAFQLNMANSTTSDIADSKIRDIEASITTFYNSLAGNFKMSGYGENVLRNYVPAIVYTLYDGYYIYSEYDNKLDESTSSNLEEDATYSDGQEIYGLKPYIYYSCRYKRGSDDFVITYSLDSYITIQGMINGKPVDDSGYLLSGVGYNGSTNTYTYRGITIGVEDGRNEGLSQKVYMPNVTEKVKDEETGEEEEVSIYNPRDIEVEQEIDVQGNLAGWIVKYPYRKINGAKYYVYTDSNTGEEKVFSMINDELLPQQDRTTDEIFNNDNAIKYYKEAYEFKERIKGYGLENLSTADAVDVNGIQYTPENNPFPIEREIFGELDNTSGTFIEDENSDFNAHRIEVIKNSIESNLIVAISNYNKVSTSDVNFAMPKLEDYEWEQLTENISMITFMQGLNIGGKVYNGHAIVQNDINEDFVSENSIYLLDTDNKEYHNFTSDEALKNVNLDTAIGLFNVDFERRTGLARYRDKSGIDVTYEETIYYYPREDQASYNSVISQKSVDSSQSISELMKQYAGKGETTKEGKLAKLYYTALGRERYGQYRVARDIESLNLNSNSN